MTTKHHTIVLCQNDSVSRVDLLARSVNAPQVLNCWPLETPPDTSLSAAVARALDLGTKPKGDVWVLTDKAWTGSVTLDAAVAEALDATEVEQAIALEAEFDSGLSPFATRTGCQRIALPDGESHWLVLQIENQIAAGLESTFQQAGLWLAGIAAIPSPTAANVGQEFDHQAVQELARQWLVKHLEAVDESLVIPCDNSALQTRSQRRILAGAMLLSILACFAAQGAINRQSQAAEQRHAWLTTSKLQQASQLARLASATKTKKQDLAAGEQRQANRARLVLTQQRQEAVNLARRKLASELLNGLATSAREQHWIRTVELDGQIGIVSGLALSAADVIRCAADLQSALSLTCNSTTPTWLVAVETTQQVDKLTDFRLRVTKSLTPETQSQLTASMAEPTQ